MDDNLNSLNFKCQNNNNNNEFVPNIINLEQHKEPKYNNENLKLTSYKVQDSSYFENDLTCKKLKKLKDTFFFNLLNSQSFSGDSITTKEIMNNKIIYNRKDKLKYKLIKNSKNITNEQIKYKGKHKNKVIILPKNQVKSIMLSDTCSDNNTILPTESNMSNLTQNKKGIKAFERNIKLHFNKTNSFSVQKKFYCKKLHSDPRKKPVVKEGDSIKDFEALLTHTNFNSTFTASNLTDSTKCNKTVLKSKFNTKIPHTEYSTKIPKFRRLQDNEISSQNYSSQQTRTNTMLNTNRMFFQKESKEKGRKCVGSERLILPSTQTGINTPSNTEATFSKILQNITLKEFFHNKKEVKKPEISHQKEIGWNTLGMELKLDSKEKGAVLKRKKLPIFLQDILKIKGTDVLSPFCVQARNEFLYKKIFYYYYGKKKIIQDKGVNNKWNILNVEDEEQFKDKLTKLNEHLRSKGKHPKYQTEKTSTEKKLNQIKTSVNFMKSIVDYAYPDMVLCQVREKSKKLRKRINILREEPFKMRDYLIKEENEKLGEDLRKAILVKVGKEQ